MATSSGRTKIVRFKLVVAVIPLASALGAAQSLRPYPIPLAKQSPLPAAYDVISIKPHKANDPGVGSWCDWVLSKCRCPRHSS